jgi:hypothetical protein
MNLFALTLILALTADRTAGMVDAAREAKKKRGASATKVITNADVRKSRGKLIERPAEPRPVVSSSTRLPTMAEHEESRKARAAIEKQIDEAQKTADALAAELAIVEARYYAEDDLDRRDRVITVQFTDVRRRLVEVAAELERLAALPEMQTADPVTVIGSESPADASGTTQNPPTP